MRGVGGTGREGHCERGIGSGVQGDGGSTGERQRDRREGQGRETGGQEAGEGSGSKAEIGTLGSNTGSGTQAAGHIVTQTRRGRGAQMLQQGCD